MACATGLVTLIYDGPVDLSLVFTQETTVSVSRSGQVSQNPIPIQTTVHDSSMWRPARITVQGYCACNGCDGRLQDESAVTSTLDDAMSRANYGIDGFYKILAENYVAAQGMALVDYNTRKTSKEPQMVNVTTVWEARNIAGTAANLSFFEGGIA